MSRLYVIAAGLCGLFLSAPLAAQEAQPAPAPQAQEQAPAPAPQAQPPAARPAPPAAPALRPLPPPPPPLAAENTWNLDLSTGGRVVIQLRPDVAPQTVERIKALTRQGFYNGLSFFRVIEGFMAQGGDPQNNGTGGSPLPDVNAEINGMLHVRGAVGMARAQDMNSANSQFYIMFVPRLQMDRNYTVFGRVVGGMNYVDSIERGEPPSSPSRILRASLGSDNVPPMTAEQIQAESARLAAVAVAVAAPDRRAAGPAVPQAPSYRPLEPVRAEGAPPRRRGH
jgi:peptidylprolyl isomerase